MSTISKTRFRICRIQILEADFRLAISVGLLFVSVCSLWGCESSESNEDKPSVSEGQPKYRSHPENVFSVVDELGIQKYKPKHKRSALKTFTDYLQAAKEALAQNAYEEAGQFAEAALALDDRSGEAHYIRGKALSASATGDDDEALRQLNVAAELGFENGDLYEYKAKIYDGRKDYKNAIVALTRAIKLEPGNRDHFRFRGALYDLIGRHEAAEDDYTTNIEMAYEKSQAYLDRGLMYEGNKRYDMALADYSRALALETRRTDELRARARVLLIMKKDELALIDLNEIVERNPQDDDTIRIRGDLYARRKEYQSAIRDYSRVIHSAPDQSRHAYEARAFVYEKIGEKEKAAADLKVASQILARPAERTLFKLKEDEYKRLAPF